MAIKPKRILSVASRELMNITETRTHGKSRRRDLFFLFSFTLDGVAAIRSVVCCFSFSNANGGDDVAFQK